MSSLRGALDRREARLERRDDRRGVVDRQGRLGQEGEVVGVGDARAAATSSTVSTRVIEPARNLAEGADHLGMAGMADEQDVAAVLDQPLGLAVDLADQRAGRIEIVEAARRAPRPAPTWARHGPRRPPGGRRAPRRAPRRRPRPGRAAGRRRSGCGRFRGGHRPARRTARSPARRSGWRGRRRRKSRAAPRSAQCSGGRFGSHCAAM